ncbi:MAG: ABC transporter permease subunit, partial [Novibacillus thermophilus]
MDFEWSVVIDALPALLKGAQLTIVITLAGLAGGLVVGTIAGLMRAYGNALLNTIAFAYIELIRGTPIVVQVMFIYFALPTLADI